MKKLLQFFMLSICLFGNAQTISFSDINFKNKLIASNTSNGFAKNNFGNNITVDINGDNEIQVVEALNVYELYLWSSSLNTNNDIINLIGIQNFGNLKKLNCSGNSITSLNLEGLSNLEYINAGGNDISNLAITGLVALKEISVAYNILTAINIDNLNNLTTLDINNNQINSLNFNNNSSFLSLRCSNNLITSLDFSLTPTIKYIVCNNNNITSINLGTINQVEEFICNNNMISNLNISNLSIMTYLVFDSNQISTINFPSANTIFGLSISNNPISTINLNSLTSLNQLFVSNTLITNLDCSQSSVQQLTCRNNSNLETINVKNGVYTYSDPDLLYFGFIIENNPQLQSICVDDGEQNNLSYNNFSYNTSGNVLVYTGVACSTLISQSTFSNGEFKLNNLVIFPNPTKSNITIIKNDTFEVTSIYITNTVGQVIKKNNNFQNNIDLSDLTSGTYFITFETYNSKITKRIIKI